MNNNNSGRNNRNNHQSGRNAGRGGGNNRNSNNSNPRKNGQRNTSNLKGACEDLKDNVYTIGDAKQADRYTKTTESIVNYIQRTYDEGQDVKDALVKLQHTDMEYYRPEIEADEDDLDFVDKMILQQEVKDYVLRKKKYEDNMNKAYGLILGQCTQGVKNKLEARQNWRELEEEHNPINLLKAIKEITQDYQDSKYPIASIYKSLATLFNIKQDEKEGLTAYTKRFKTAQDIMESQHGPLDLNPYTTRMEGYNEDEHNEFTDIAYNQLLAYIFIQGADPKRSGNMLKELSNDFALGANKYPKDVAAATSAIANYKQADNNRNYNNNNRNRNRNNNNNGNEKETQVGFAQRGNQNKKWLSNIECYNCGEKGHFARDCPKKQQGASNAQTSGTTNNTNNTDNSSESQNDESNQNASGRSESQFLMNEISVHNNTKKQSKSYLREVVLLDNQSTTDIFCNKDFLEDIQEVSETLYLDTNGGVLKCNHKGTLPGYGEVWYNDKAIANVISMSNAEKKGKYQITYDKNVGFTMKNLINGNINVFKKDATGLYITPKKTELSMLNTVEENKKLYTKRQVARAEEARKLYQVIGYPSLRDYKHIIQTNQIKNCPVTIEDINISEKIFGPDVYAIKGKSVRKKPKVVVNDYIEIPRELIQAHKGIILCADIMFIDQVGFLVTMSKHIKFITIRYIPDRKKDTLLEAFDATFIKYNNAGFVIKDLHVDPEFECIKSAMEFNEIYVNLTAAEEHQADIERLFRVIKERYRAIYHRCPFGMWPKIMIIRGASHAVKWLNTFPPSGGISTTYSPRAIITGRPVDYDKHCKIRFGSYVQASTQNEPTNTPKERTIDAIFLRTLDNIQGGYEVLNLKTGKPITRHTIVELPTPPEVIKRVEQLAANEGFKPHAEPIFKMYTLLAGVDDYNSTATDEPEEDDDYEYEEDDDLTYNEQVEQEELQELASTPGVETDNNQSIHPNQNNTETAEIEENTVETAETEEDSEEEEDRDELARDDEPIPEPLRRTTRTPKPRSFLKPSFKGQVYEETNHLITQVHPENTLDYESAEAEILAQAFVQTYNLTRGIQKFGDKGRQAAIDEMRQLHDRECFIPIDINKLDEKARRTAMESLIFLVEKRDGRIKARNVADGSKQRTWMSKEEAASPTVALESVMLSAVIDAKEEREVAVVDIPNAFIQTENERLQDHHKKDILKVKGRLADMLIMIAPEVYGAYATKENGITVIYLEILRALYGMIKSPLLFYRKLRKDLEEAGFKINPYDICVANKLVNGKQFTVMWHVDDLKISHVEKAVVDNFIEWARHKYEDSKITKLKPSRGKVHDYLGITLDYTTKGKVRIYMKQYIEKMLQEFPYMDQVSGIKKVATPAAEYLFTVNTKAEKLEESLKEDFHTTVAKGLFLCKRARPDLQPTIPFLCTRVKDPDIDDWKKLLRMLKYLEGTKDLELTLEAENGNVLLCKWYPDAAFAVHSDFKSHTGAVLTLGKGAVNTISAKQKLNTRSSTEAELVGADDTVTQALWTKNFLSEQGYTSETTIYQDNTSAILLEKKGTESSSKRTRHINIRYYFIKDCIDKKHLTVKYCPTDDMIGDYPSKPLQGKKFKKHRKTIMNETITSNNHDIKIGQQECVEAQSVRFKEPVCI